MAFLLKNSLKIWYSPRYLPWYLTRGRVTRPRSIKFTIRLRLDLGDRLLVFASTMNIELVPRFAEIWLERIQIQIFSCFRFIVSREKCVHIYKFFLDNFPKKYGHIDPAMIEKNGYELIRVLLTTVEFQWGSEIRPFEIWNYLKSRLFEIRTF